MENQKIIKSVENNFKDLWKTICNDTKKNKPPAQIQGHTKRSRPLLLFVCPFRKRG